MNYNLLCVLGATATGKTKLAVALAQKLSGEIISADSRQVYKSMDIGTGKDIEEYEDTPYHLIDIHPAGYKYNVYEFQQDFRNSYKEIVKRNNLPILCGGSGMYLESVLQDYNMSLVPEDIELRKHLKDKPLSELIEILKTYKSLHNTSDIITEERTIRAIEIAKYEKENTNRENLSEIKLNPLTIGIQFSTEERRRRITERLHSRLENGMVQEVEQLLNSGIKAEDLLYYGLEYKFITLYLTNKISYDELISNLNTAIHRFAKRQMTWFRRMEKRGVNIHWIDGELSLDDQVQKTIELYQT